MLNKKKEVPVYIFTGFLESGKSTFIEETLEGENFNDELTTLLLVCEEGEVEYEPERFASDNIRIEIVEDEEDLTREYLEKLQDDYNIDRVLVEYNGMWLLEKLFINMPEEWAICQEMTFVDAETFISYNQNMRQFVYDKLQGADMVIFNRCTRGFDKMEFHKIVRGANRKNQIIYEYEKDEVEFDNIPDPLPFDLDADLVLIKDEDFAQWYADINEEQDKYEGKILSLKGRSVLGGGLDKDSFVFGRHVMTCCEDDIQFAGLVCTWEDAADKLTHGGWVKVEARVSCEYHAMYGEVGPVLICSLVEETEAPKPEVASF